MPSEIDRHAAQRLHSNGARFVDVLPDAEFAESHIPGAINVPLKTLGRETTLDLPRDEPVVVYCHDSR